MSEFYVYVLLDPRKNNQPFYVGKGKGDRCTKHGNEKIVYNEFKENVIKAIRCKGLEYIIEIVESNLSEIKAFDKEIELIKKYSRRGIEIDGILVNRTFGGEGASGRIVSEITKKKISSSNKGKQSNRKDKSYEEIYGEEKAEELRKSRSESGKKNKGRKYSEEEKKNRKVSGSYERAAKKNTGRKRSTETIDRLRKSHLGLKDSEETKLRKSHAAKGRRISTEGIKNMKAAKTGANNPMYGMIGILNSRSKKSPVR